MRLRIARIGAAVTLLGALVLVAAPEGAEAKGFKRCGKADIGYTEAKVKSRNVGCATARRVVRRFVDKYPGPRSQDCVLESCRVERRFRCIFGGSPGIAKLGCTNPKGSNKDLKAKWGD